jgi:hypothetical protein
MVTNSSSDRLDIYITVYELTSTGRQLDDRRTGVTGLAAGRSGRWSSRVLVDDDDACEVVISDAFES